MPSTRIVENFSLLNLNRYIRVFVSVAFLFISYGFIGPSLVNPDKADAVLGCNWYNGQCKRHDGAGVFSDCPADHCGGGSGGSCSVFAGNFGEPCTGVRVPGGQGATTCPSDPEITYEYGNGPSNPPTTILIDFKCPGPAGSHPDWSEANAPDNPEGMNVHIWNWNTNKWDHINKAYRDPARPNPPTAKIENGRSLVRFELNAHPLLAELTRKKEFLIYPNCLDNDGGPDKEEIIESGCYRDATMGPEDNALPFCEASSTLQGSDIKIDFNATDKDTGVERYGVWYRPLSGSPSVPIVNNDGTIFPPSKNYFGSALMNRAPLDNNPNTIYEAIVNVWDVADNTYQCRTTLPCVMPPVDVDFASCTPVGLSTTELHNIPVGTVNNLKLGGNYCQVDYVDITPGSFSTGYSAKATEGASSLSLTTGFLWNGNPWNMTPSRNYSIRYWDGQTDQHEYGTVTTPPACNPPSTPSIDYTPECKIPYVTGDPNLYKRNLIWNRPSSRGDNFLGYDIQVAKGNTGNVVYSSTLSSSGSNLQEEVALATSYIPQITPGDTYYYRVRAKSYGGYSNWTNWSSRLLQTKPTAATNFRATGVNSGTPTINLNWDYSNSSAPNNQAFSWTLLRTPIVTGVGSATFSGPTTSYSDTRALSQAGRCNNTDYTYTLTGSNTCGAGPGAQTIGRCPANTAPTCGAIQYSENGGTTWTNYPTGSTGLTRDRNTSMLLRRVNCTDAENDPLTYTWSTSVGCGTFNPSSSSSNQTTYTFSSSYNVSCDLTSRVRDSVNLYAPDANVVAKTWPLPNAGTHRFLASSQYIERLNTADQYKPGADYATMTYRITGYYNPTVQGGSENKLGTLTIDTTSNTTSSGVLNICKTGVATCTFTSGGTTTATDSSHVIRIAFDSNYVKANNLKEILRDTANTASRFGIKVTFTAEKASGGSITPISTTGTPPIRNNPTRCENVTFTNSPGGSGNMGIQIRAKDDWGLKDYRIRYAKSTTPSDFNNITSGFKNFNSNARDLTVTENWSLSSISNGRYNIHIDIRDLDGQTVSCTADQSTGDEGGGSTPPVVIVDKAVPQCTLHSITVDATGTQLRFDTTGTDPTTGGTYSGLASLSLSYQPGATGAFTSIKTVTLTRPQSYRYYNSPTADVNLTNVPSGPSVYRATWTDAAGNTINCDTTYQKPSRISGRVLMEVAEAGGTLRDFRFQPSGSQFAITTSDGVTSSSVDWNSASGSGTGSLRCTATYPGNATNDSTDLCNAYYISNTQFQSTGTKTVSLNVGTLSGRPTIGKYRCKIQVIQSGTVRQTVNSNGDNGVCSITINNSYFTHGGVGLNNQTEWPTQVNFTLDYNSEQISGKVYNADGSGVGSGYSVSVNGNNSSSFSSGSYQSPSGSSADNTYVTNIGSNRTATVVLTPPSVDETKLCVWTYKSDFTAVPNTNNLFNSSSKIQGIAQSLSLSGWQVGVSEACTVTNLDLARNNTTQPGVNSFDNKLSPKYQHQVNFMHLPKVKVTGKIFYLKDDNQCGNASSWDSGDESAASPIDVDLDFNDNISGTFYNPKGNNSYKTGETFEFYANSLPSNWGSWSISPTVTPTGPNASIYTVCGDNGNILPSGQISDYPNTSEITANIGIYIKETNDWWQAYNGGVHAEGAISNAIPSPSETTLPEESGSIEIHNLIGKPDISSIYGESSGHKMALRSPFNTYFAGGLVSSESNLPDDIVPGVGTKNWSYISPNMKPVRIPYSSSDSNISAIDRIKEDRSSGSSLWKNNGTYEYNSGTKNINSELTYSDIQYIAVDGHNMNITRNIINDSNTKPVFIIVDGNVDIGKDVTRIDAVIFASGDITIESSGIDTAEEKSIKIYGGLYATGDVVFQRDLENNLNNFGIPSTQVMFNPRLVIGSRDPSFPKELKESNVYWTQVE